MSLDTGLSVRMNLEAVHVLILEDGNSRTLSEWLRVDDNPNVLRVRRIDVDGHEYEFIRDLPMAIDYQTVIDAVQIVEDGDPVNPFTNDEFLAHTQKQMEYSGQRKSRAYYHDGRNRFIIEPEDDDSELFRYARAKGASKQVAYEYRALMRRNRIDAIKREYEGVTKYGVCIEVNDGGEPPAYMYDAEDNTDPSSPWFCAPDISEVVWGFEEESAKDEGVYEIASQAISVLEEAGWTVNGAPDRRQSYYASRRNTIRDRSKMFTWRD